MAEWTITNIMERRDIGPTGEVVTVYEVSWMYGDMGPFTVEVKKSEFSAERVRAEIEKQAQEIKRLLSM